MLAAEALDLGGGAAQPRDLGLGRQALLEQDRLVRDLLPHQVELRRGARDLGLEPADLLRELVDPPPEHPLARRSHVLPGLEDPGLGRHHIRRLGPERGGEGEGVAAAELGLEAGGLGDPGAPAVEEGGNVGLRRDLAQRDQGRAAPHEFAVAHHYLVDDAAFEMLDGPHAAVGRDPAGRHRAARERRERAPGAEAGHEAGDDGEPGPARLPDRLPGRDREARDRPAQHGFTACRHG